MLPVVENIARVVVCEDDEITREMLCENLRHDRYEALPAAGAEEALQRCRFDAPDVLLLDLNLPDASGLDVLREIRRAEGPAPVFDPALPVLVISGRSSDGDRVRGLRDGADDYLTKPFNPRELVARVKAILRRSRPGRGALDEAAPLHLGDVTIDPASREVTVGGRPATVRTKEFDLLHALAEHRGRVLTREQLLSLVWGFDFLGQTRTVDVHIAHLRKILAGSRASIETVTGVGYKLVVAEA